MTISISAPLRKTAAMKEIMPDAIGESSLKIAVTGISRLENGGFVKVIISLSTGEKRDKRVFILPFEDFFTLGIRRGEIDTETFERVERSAKLYDACCRGERMLGYGTNSKKRLEMKLRSKGFDADIAQEAVEKLSERGYINEYEDALRAAKRFAASCHGPRLVVSKLIMMGYDREMAKEVRAAMDERCFSSYCAEFIKKRYYPFPTEKKARCKAIDVLMNRGYPSSIVREALEILRESDDDLT